MLDMPPPVVISYYEARDHPRLVRAVERADLPTGTTVYFGSYYGLKLRPPAPPPPRPRPPPPRVPGGAYAPMFSLQRSAYWRRRDISRAQARRLRGTREARRRGRIPALGRLLEGSSALRWRWGVELGKRFRDGTRGRRRYGERIRTWQFDEIPSQVAGRRGRPYREIVRAVLRGLTEGRRRLGDERRRGIVWMAQHAFGLVRRPARGELRRFWSGVNRAAMLFVGEEYPTFTGSPSRAAARQAGKQRSLAARGGARRALAHKYVPGLTPGRGAIPGLGGNVGHRSRAAVDRWRNAYVRARARRHPAGFAEFHFLRANRFAMEPALAAVAAGVRALRR